MKILVVDDDKELADAVARSLRRHGHYVVTTYTALDAVAQVQKEAFHLALIDYELGTVMTGVDVARHVPRATALIMITGHDVKEMRGEIADPLEPFLEIISKPFTNETIRREVDRVARMLEDTKP